MAFGVENGGGSGTPAGRPLPYLKHALPARQELLEVAAGRIVPPVYCIAAMTTRDISSSVIRTPEQGHGTDEHMRTGVWIIRSTTSNTSVPSPTATS